MNVKNKNHRSVQPQANGRKLLLGHGKIPLVILHLYLIWINYNFAGAYNFLLNLAMDWRSHLESPSIALMWWLNIWWTVQFSSVFGINITYLSWTFRIRPQANQYPYLPWLIIITIIGLPRNNPNKYWSRLHSRAWCAWIPEHMLASRRYN